MSTEEIRGFRSSVIRTAIDPEGKLPEVRLIPDGNPNYDRNTDKYLLVDITHGGAGQATIVQTPNQERYFTKLDIADVHLDREVRLAAYLVAIENTTLNHGETFTNDPLADLPEDVEVWEELARARIAEIESAFTPLVSRGGEASPMYYRGNAHVLPPIGD